jgi:NAD(P)-dependent dehydrogenase (short-subunit alcohol dehydrogenase family)
MGVATATRLAEEGAQLTLLDISQRRLDSALGSVAAAAPEAEVTTYRLSVIERDAVYEFAQSLDARGWQPDVLVNIVGGLPGLDLTQTFFDLDEDRWDATFDLNLKGLFNLVQALAPGMMARGYGRIVNIGSTSYNGDKDRPEYAAAKAGVVSLTRSLADAFAPAITVNCLSPGVVATSIVDVADDEFFSNIVRRTLLGRVGRPEDIAAAVAFLGSDDASYITGAHLPVSGGIPIGL